MINGRDIRTHLDIQLHLIISLFERDDKSSGKNIVNIRER